MTTSNRKPETTSTPRKNQKRECSGEIPLKIYGEDSDESSDSFGLFTHTPENVFTPLPSPSSVLDLSKLRSAQGMLNKVKDFTPRSRRAIPQEYDPENDVFINSPINSKFNTDELKSCIERCIKSSDVPAYKLDFANCCDEKPTVKQRRPYKRREKSTPKEPEPEVIDVGDEPRYGCSSPEAMWAIIHGKKVIERMRAKRNCLLSLANENAGNHADTPIKNELPHALGALEENPGGSSEQACCSTSTVKSSEDKESGILKGVVAYVDVISSKDEDLSGGVRDMMMKLGATVLPTFTKKDPVSVVVFNNGHISTYKKAMQRGIPLVSSLWIEESRQTGTQPPMSKFPPINVERYECPKFIKKIKKRKIVYTTVPIVRRKTRKMVKNIEPLLEDPKPKEATPPEFVSKTDVGPAWLQKYKQDSGLAFLVGLTGVNEEQFNEMMVDPIEPETEKYDLSPLPMRLLYRKAKDMSSSVDWSFTPLTKSSPTTCCSSGSNSEPVPNLTSLNGKSCEATGNHLQECKNNTSIRSKNAPEESPKTTPKVRYSKRIQNFKKKLNY